MAPMEQLYVCLSEMKDVPDQTNLSAEELGWQHHAYLQNLLDRGILMGSGSAKDETGRRHAGGIIIVRAASLQEAEAIAAREPYFANGQRSTRVIPWQRTWFGD
jgi:uncharacterized protein YciI